MKKFVLVVDNGAASIRPEFKDEMARIRATERHEGHWIVDVPGDPRSENLRAHLMQFLDPNCRLQVYEIA